jgi:hypothetical protein
MSAKETLARIHCGYAHNIEKMFLKLALMKGERTRAPDRATALPGHLLFERTTIGL